jgi:hypothetical protein
MSDRLQLFANKDKTNEVYRILERIFPKVDLWIENPQNLVHSNPPAAYCSLWRTGNRINLCFGSDLGGKLATIIAQEFIRRFPNYIKKIGWECGCYYTSIEEFQKCDVNERVRADPKPDPHYAKVLAEYQCCIDNIKVAVKEMFDRIIAELME